VKSTGLRVAVLAAVIVTFIPLEESLPAQSTTGVWPNPGDCSNISPIEQRQCISRRMDAKERTLERLYPKALASVKAGFAKWGSGDIRMNPIHFVRAHRDWRRFVDSNCTALAAFGGGSNSSISDREAECHERELDQRIALYRQLANGTYGL
jgi:uncharacterized protein YecT (DUF1311 family)